GDYVNGDPDENSELLDKAYKSMMAAYEENPDLVGTELGWTDEDDSNLLEQFGEEKDEHESRDTDEEESEERHREKTGKGIEFTMMVADHKYEKAAFSIFGRKVDPQEIMA